MPRRVIDLSTPIRTGHFRWRAERKELQSHAEGDIAQVTWFGATVHGFTHVDSERHFSPDGKTFDEVPLERYMGPAAVVDVSEDMQPCEVLARLRSWREIGQVARAIGLVTLKGLLLDFADQHFDSVAENRLAVAMLNDYRKQHGLAFRYEGKRVNLVCANQRGSLHGDCSGNGGE